MRTVKYEYVLLFNSITLVCSVVISSASEIMDFMLKNLVMYHSVKKIDTNVQATSKGILIYLTLQQQKLNHITELRRIKN